MGTLRWAPAERRSTGHLNDDKIVNAIDGFSPFCGLALGKFRADSAQMD
jgi:hypothetical protein